MWAPMTYSAYKQKILTSAYCCLLGKQSIWFTCGVCSWLVFCLKYSTFGKKKKSPPRERWRWLHFLQPAALLSASVTDISFFCPSALKNAAFGALVSSQRSSVKIPPEQQTAFGNQAPSKMHFQTLFWITQSPHNSAINAGDKYCNLSREFKGKNWNKVCRQCVDQTLKVQCLPKPKYSIPSSQTKIYTESF